MTDSPHPRDIPPVYVEAGDTTSPSSPEVIQDTLEELTASERATYLGVSYWQCPFECDDSSPTITGIRSHITASKGVHEGETGRTPSRPIPGYSVSNELVAVLTSPSTTSEESIVLPAMAGDVNQPVILEEATPPRHQTQADGPVSATAGPLDAAPGTTKTTVQSRSTPPSESDQDPPTSDSNPPDSSSPAVDVSPTSVQEGVSTSDGPDALSDPVQGWETAIPLGDFSLSASDLKEDVGAVRWICTLCGEFTADTPGEVVSHVHAHTDDQHEPTESQPVALWLSTNDDAIAGVLLSDNRPQVLPSTELPALPAVSLPEHWAFRSEYTPISPDDVDVDVWECPYCEYRRPTAAGVRSHIQGSQDDVHSGQSGHYPDEPIYGYRGDTAVAMLSPANKADPNDQSVCLSLETPDLESPINLAVATLRDVAPDFEAALEVLDVELTLTDEILAAAIGITPDEFSQAHDSVLEAPESVREQSIDEATRRHIAVQLAAELAERVDDPEIGPATLLQTPSVQTPASALDSVVGSAPSPGTNPQAADADIVDKETTDSGTVVFNIDADDRDDTAAVDAIPPEPELAAADLNELYGYFDAIKDLIDQDINEQPTSNRDTTAAQLETIDDVFRTLGQAFPSDENQNGSSVGGEEV